MKIGDIYKYNVGLYQLSVIIIDILEDRYFTCKVLESSQLEKFPIDSIQRFEQCNRVPCWIKQKSDNYKLLLSKLTKLEKQYEISIR